jgi:AbiV family abortive infection protein
MTYLTPNQLLDGYGKAISNGFRLLEASLELAPEFPEIALGLGEIGQEEIGKSLSFLAAFSLGRDQSWFWSAWKDHQTKAHRAFLYELISPVRLEIVGPDGPKSIGRPQREKIRHEKEFSFYVNYDSKSGRFVSPQKAVQLPETHNRVMTLLYLACTAWSVKAALDEADQEFRYKTFSEVAFRICSENLYQQDMPALFAEFERRSPQHKALSLSLGSRLVEAEDYLKSIIRRPAASSQPPLERTE